MREIKFRGKLLVTGEIKYFTLFDIAGEEMGHLSLHGGYVIAKDSIQQYTGLKDKNGKEIYEGDIMKNLEGHLVTVAWIQPVAGFQPLININPIVFEVIGNIYENPELLK